MMGDSDALYNYEESDLETFMTEAKKLVEQAAVLIQSAIGKTKAISEVSLKDFNSSEGHGSQVLTETDQAVEKLIIEGLQKIFLEGGGKLATSKPR